MYEVTNLRRRKNALAAFKTRVSDPNSFLGDLDPAFEMITDPHPAFLMNTGPDPDLKPYS